MKRLFKVTSRPPEEVLQAAVTFFGPGGVGLPLEDQSDGCLVFQGGGGFVRVSSTPDPSGSGSSVEVETSEWEQPATRFVADL